MENKKIIKELIRRLGLIFIVIIVFFLLVTFLLDIQSNFSIYLKRNEYRTGNMIVTRIGSDSHGSPHLFADGYINNIKTSIYLGLEKDVNIKDHYPILYKKNGKQSFLITKNFKFNPVKFLYYGILEILSIPIGTLIILKIYKYFKNDRIES